MPSCASSPDILTAALEGAEMAFNDNSTPPRMAATADKQLETALASEACLTTGFVRRRRMTFHAYVRSVDCAADRQKGLSDVHT